MCLERIRRRAHHFFIGAFGHGGHIAHLAVDQTRFLCEGAHAAFGDGGQIVMHQTGVHQLAEHEARATRSSEAVHIGVAIRIDAGQQRHDLR
ncbi:hypothetical protein D3C81_873890 [compost metagenome]